jgi:hypothetical protein
MRFLYSQFGEQMREEHQVATSTVAFVFAETQSQAVMLAAEVLGQCFQVVNYAESPAREQGVTDVWLVENEVECWPIRDLEVPVLWVGTIPLYLILCRAEELLKQLNLD